MSYVNLVSQVCTDKAEAFCRLRDFICKRNGTYDYSTTGIGWTLWDSSYAVDEDNPQLNDWFIIKSAGEPGDDDMYFKFEWTSGYIKIGGYLSWDPSAHSGSSRYYGTNNVFNIAEGEASFQISIFGDLDHVVCMFYDVTYNQWVSAHFGTFHPVGGINRDTATCSSALTAGSDVPITVDAVPSDWEVGTELFIRTTHTNNMATTQIEKITIKTLVGNTITADLSNSYTAGNKLCRFLAYSCIGSTQIVSTVYILSNGTVDLNSYGNFINLNFTVAQIDPTYYEDLYASGPLIFQAATGGWPLSICPNMLYINGTPAGVVDNDTFTDFSGVTWRIRKCYSNKFILLKEV